MNRFSLGDQDLPVCIVMESGDEIVGDINRIKQVQIPDEDSIQYVTVEGEDGEEYGVVSERYIPYEPGVVYQDGERIGILDTFVGLSAPEDNPVPSMEEDSVSF